MKNFPLLRLLCLHALLAVQANLLFGQRLETEIDRYNITWNSQSNNSSESMPCGGGDIGMNVWVENNDLLIYVARSGWFDENNALLKVGRIRVKLSPNPFAGGSFQQQLILQDGTLHIVGEKGKLRTNIIVWADVKQPVAHVSIESNQPTAMEAIYESWRYKNRINLGKANNANSYKWAPQGDVITTKDSIAFLNNSIVFFHRNQPNTVFDLTVKQQRLESVKEQMFNPLGNLTFGGVFEGTNMIAAGNTNGKYIDTDFEGWKLKSKKASLSHQLQLLLHTAQTKTLDDWENGLQQSLADSKANLHALEENKQWWNAFWQRSFIFINPANGNVTDTAWQVARNYQLFRYMLACNAFGQYPTKFNGGLFTYDPVFTDTSLHYTPDFRNWGGGTHTAQNQRLVYFPMIRSGDFDLLKPQFDFYLRILKNAELRSQVYWNHGGACFTEQMENFGLPNSAEYAWKRPAGFDNGVEYNAWLEYLWDTSLEFCLMMLEEERYTQKDITAYIPFIESCLRFFDEHYQWLAKQRGRKALNDAGQLILFPGSGAETFKMTYNSTSTIAALKTVTSRLLKLPPNYLDEVERKSLDSFYRRLPPIAYNNIQGHTTISPAKAWERINNVESPQLYPVFPWGMFGIGKSNIDTAINTWKFDSNVVKFRSHVGWKQDNIFAARLGLTEDAKTLTFAKLQNSGRRFPAFWGPGFDWTPDHNWGGSGMIGLQEMLLQTDDKKIYLFPAWPSELEVHFKLNAPYQTTVEAEIKSGKLIKLKVIPEERLKDVTNMLGGANKPVNN